MQVNQHEIWIADLNSQIGTEAGKTRPVLIVQTDLLKSSTSIYNRLSNNNERSK